MIFKELRLAYDLLTTRECKYTNKDRWVKDNDLCGCHPNSSWSNISLQDFTIKTIDGHKVTNFQIPPNTLLNFWTVKNRHTCCYIRNLSKCKLSHKKELCHWSEDKLQILHWKHIIWKLITNWSWCEYLYSCFLSD